MMDNGELRKLQQQYIDESNAFLECLRQKVPLNVIEKKREKIREISRLIDEKIESQKPPLGSNPRSG
jgi:hypothetical protein